MTRLPIFLALCVPYTVLVRRFWFTTDDAFISFRFAKNLALGHGIRFNLGDHTPVEGYSNFLWVLVCALLEKLQLEITLWPCLVSAACGYVLLWLVLDRLTRRLDVSPLPAALSALTLAAFPPFGLWSSSGLATMPFALLVFLTFDRLVLREQPDALGGGLAALALSLIRVEGIAWCGVLFVIAAASHRRRFRPLLTAAAILAAGYAIYSGWRLSHHGGLLPNTAQAKLGASVLLAGWLRGFRYVSVHFLTFVTPFLLLPATVMALRRRRRAKAIPVVLMAWAFPAYAVAVTGDFMAMGRFLVPSFAFQTVLLAWMIQDLSARAPVRVALAAAITVLGVLPGWDIHLIPYSFRHEFRFRRSGFAMEGSEYRYWNEGQKRHAVVGREMGSALRRYVELRPFQKPNPVATAARLGGPGYYSGLTMIDRAGLVTPEVLATGFTHHPSKSTPGHDRVRPGFLVALRPDLLRPKYLETAHPCSVLAACRKMGNQLLFEPDEPDLSSQYIVDFARVSDVVAPHVIQVVVAWRKIERGPDEEWSELAAHVDSLAALCPGGRRPAIRRVSRPRR